MIPTLQLGQLGRRIKLPAGGGGTSYDTVMAATSPLLRWKLEETSGSTAADSSGNGYTGTIQGGGTFASSGVSIAAASGFAGLGRGVDFVAPSFDRVQSGNNAALALGTSAAGAWTIVLWVSGNSVANAYLADRQNDQALIYNFTANTVEFFAVGYTGSDPRTGSGISLLAADTTTPRMIVYRYDNGQWAGFKDGASVFSVARSFALAGAVQHWNLGAADASNGTEAKMWDFAVHSRALTDTEIADLYAARNSA